MKFAIVDGVRQEARPNIAGVCPSCGKPMAAKCGKIKAWHWAHRGKRDCDLWWENETEWHRNWKDQFPLEWQEVIHYAGNGEKHIADVKTAQGWVIEFQHSRIAPEERYSRNAFYEKLVWVVDGTRLKRDIKQFDNAWGNGSLIGRNPGIRVVDEENCTILKEWSDCGVPVFLDFGIPNLLWWLHSKNSDGATVVAVLSRTEFINLHLGLSKMAKTFDELVEAGRNNVEDNKQPRLPKASTQVQTTMRRLVPRHRSRRL